MAAIVAPSGSGKTMVLEVLAEKHKGRLVYCSEDLSSRTLLIKVAKADTANQVGVLNEGYWGMALRPRTTYHGSFYARADAAGMGPVTVALRSDNTGKIEASATVAEPTTDWKLL